MKSRLLPSAALVFGSGFSALLYQTTWLREFRLIFGSTTAASAAVLAIFMGGLGAGSALFGRRAENSRRPLAFYAKLELLIAVSAMLTPILIALVRMAYVACGGTLAMGLVWGTCVRLLLATIVLGVPTLLMGGTLPAIARFAVSDNDTSRRGLALLYGMNALGAVAGAALGTFFLLERFGNHVTLWLACLLNASVAAAALLLARGESSRASAEISGDQSLEAAAPFRLVLFAAAITGFVFLLMELVWYRMLSPLLGGTAFTFGLILAVALFGIGMGGVLYSLVGGQRRPTLNGFACTCALEALCIAIPFAIGDRLALTAMFLQPLGTLGFYGRVLGWTALCSVIVLPAAIVAGIQFPMLIGLLGKGRDKVAAQTGTAYAWNTGGAIAGSLAGGFGFIPIFTAPGTWQIVVVALAVCAFLATIIAQRKIGKPVHSLPAVLVGSLAICLMFFATGPTAAWRHSPMGLGLIKKYEGTPNQMHDFLNAIRRDILWEADGREVSIGISGSDGLAFMVNGKCDGNARGDADTQVMSGLLGALAHPHPASAAVVGLGTGSTAGWLAAVPSIERVDAVEIEPALLRFAAQCALVNHDALNNPKLHVLVGDGREFLLTSKQPYDLIVSEPSNPYRAGVASLFTREYYQAAAKKLNPGGVFVQWMQAYDVDARTIQIFYATFSSVFPHIETWQTGYGDLLLLGSEEPIRYDISALRARIAEEPFKSALAKTWRTTGVEGVFSHYIGNERFPQVVMRGRGIPLNTDDRTLLEFAFARNLRLSDSFQFDNLRRDAHLFEAERPMTTGTLDWNSIEEQRLGMFVALDHATHAENFISGGEKVLGAAFDCYAHDDFTDAWQNWKQLGREPHGIVELAMVAECLADQGDAKAFAYIGKLKEIEPTEGQAIEARLLWRQNRKEEAGIMIGKVLQSFRADPWPLGDLVRRTMNLTREIAQADKTGASARIIFSALQEPFAVHIKEEIRLRTLLSVGMVLDHGQAGAYTLRGIPEPNVPWQLGFLKLRRACYESLGSPRLAQAQRDLDVYIKADTDFVEPKDSPVIAPIDRVASAEANR